MNAKRTGPVLTVAASCLGCEYEVSEYYEVQGDSGCNVSCRHPDGRGRVGDTNWRTPAWCPLLVAANQRLAETLGAES